MRDSMKYPLFVIVFLFSFIAFLPKENIYFYYLEKLQEKNISVQNEERSSGAFRFSILNSDVFYKDINAFKIESFEASYYLVSGKIDILNVMFDGLTIDNIELKWNIVSPLKFDIVILSDQLSGYGTYHLLERDFELYLKPSAKVVKKYETFWSFGELMPSGEYKIEYNL